MPLLLLTAAAVSDWYSRVVIFSRVLGRIPCVEGSEEVQSSPGIALCEPFEYPKNKIGERETPTFNVFKGLLCRRYDVQRELEYF